MNSDHFAVLFTLPITSLHKAGLTVKIRKLKDIDLQASSWEITKSRRQQKIRAADKASDAYGLYNTTLRTLLDDHAPVTQRNITTRTECPWLNSSIQQAKAKRRILDKNGGEQP